MKRGPKNQQPLPLERQVGKALNDEEVGQKSRKLCGILSAIDGLRDEIRSVSKDRKDRIMGLEAEAKALRQQILDGIEMRAQSTLRYEDTDEAKKALAKVAEKAGEPKPSEPHAFKGLKGRPFECSVCGASVTDPIHGNGKTGDAFAFTGEETPDKVIRTHAAVDLGDEKRRKVINRKARAKGPLGRKKEARP